MGRNRTGPVWSVTRPRGRQACLLAALQTTTDTGDRY